MSQQLGRYSGFEGIDGAGKSMQINLTEEYAERKGINAIFVHEPGGTEMGVEIRNFLLFNRNIKLSPLAEFALFTADRIHLMDTVIGPALEKDTVVITDRRRESGVYQEAGGGLTMKQMTELSAQLLPDRYMNPDSLVVLTVSPEVRLQRLQKRFAKVAADKMEDREIEFYERVQAGYQRLKSLPYVHMIDSERDPDDIFKDVKPILFGKFAR